MSELFPFCPVLPPKSIRVRRLTPYFVSPLPCRGNNRTYRVTFQVTVVGVLELKCGKSRHLNVDDLRDQFDLMRRLLGSVPASLNDLQRRIVTRFRERATGGCAEGVAYIDPLEFRMTLLLAQRYQEIADDGRLINEGGIIGNAEAGRLLAGLIEFLTTVGDATDTENRVRVCSLAPVDVEELI